MRRAAWVCAVAGVVVCAVAPATMDRWRALRPVPPACAVPGQTCRLVIPPEEFKPGGMLWPPTADMSAPPVVLMQLPPPVSIVEPKTVWLLLTAVWLQQALLIGMRAWRRWR